MLFVYFPHLVSVLLYEKHMKHWKLLAVVAEGESLKISGADVWSIEWNALGSESLMVPHPSYPDQRHKLTTYYICNGESKIEFAAGELSNCVWCFYVPA